MADRTVNETTDTNQASEELKSILGEIPNYIFDYLELSDDTRKEWKYGSKASDFGGHNQFVQQFSKRLEALIRTEKLKLLAEVRERVIEQAKPDKRKATSWQQGIEVSAYEDAVRVYEYKMDEQLTKLEAEL